MNKLIVVTGGTKGIGRAILQRFAAAGFDVVTCGRNEEQLARFKTDMEQLQVKAYPFKADMRDAEQVATFCKSVTNLNRPVDVLVNNAGYFVPGSVLDEPRGTLESMIETNLYSAYYTTRGLIGQIKNGHIFNMCSIASIKAYPNGGSYAISKFALLGFSKVLREELKPAGVRVTAILPGATKTDSWAGSTLPDSRFMKPEDVAEAVFSAWSLSPHSVVEELLIRPQLGDI
ncbi:MAG: SDR family oxidoreductase [Cyclobacteriaceae bacterium]|nr:MAG: SDR family oxidoreductase [Cyclobacteriaceae bacterium]